jgi:16S rRNA (uracil1498-N3)-methyltransferase
VERRTGPMMRLFVERIDEGRVELTGDALQHARVRRVQPGDAVELLDGSGRVGSGRISEAARNRIDVEIERIAQRQRPATLEVLVPVADRDRLLLAAEKCAELQVTAWRPVHFARSRSVSPRGEGPKFRDKVRARMRSALEQSGGAWMPEIFEECELADALRAVHPDLRGLVLDAQGAPVARTLEAHDGGVALLIGPEGGLEAEEQAVALRAGWTAVALADTTLRFETAIVSAVAVVRALQLERSRR